MKRVDFLDDLLGLLAVSLIMTSKDRFVCCKDNEPITLLVDRLKKYDLLPVFAKKIKYFVSKTKVDVLLEGNPAVKVKDIKQAISENDSISEDEPIYQYFLKRKEPIFVTKQNEVVGIVTPADLNKTPSKMLFYILISVLERLLINFIKNLNLTDSKIEGIIGFTKWWEAKGRYEQAKRKKIELSLIECLNTSDLINIACKRPRIRKLLNYHSEPDALTSLSPLVDLRNMVMHTGYLIIQSEEQLIKRRAEYKRIRQHITDLT